MMARATFCKDGRLIDWKNDEAMSKNIFASETFSDLKRLR
jgi:hypothetical protein